MNPAILKIYSDIGEGGITSKDVSDFLDQSTDADSVIVRINSRGGDVSEGWAIHDLLVGSGKKIKTIGEGKIYSIATIVFLSGSEREIMANADGLIHNPFIPGDNMAGDYRSSDLTLLAEHMAQEEAKILDFYVERTGASKEKLAEYMANDTKFSAQDMLDLGFATKIIEPVKAFAYIKLKNNIMEENEIKTFGQKLDTIKADLKALFSRLPSKDLTLTDKDGKEITIEKTEGSPAIGDKATPDGSFTMADGKIITVAGGLITDIKEPAEAKTELELANEKIAELTAKLAEAENVKTEAEAEKVAFTEAKEKAVALVDELSKLKNTWKPETRSKISSVEKTGRINIDEVRELMESTKNK